MLELSPRMILYCFISHVWPFLVYYPLDSCFIPIYPPCWYFFPIFRNFRYTKPLQFKKYPHRLCHFVYLTYCFVHIPKSRPPLLLLCDEISHDLITLFNYYCTRKGTIEL